MKKYDESLVSKIHQACKTVSAYGIDIHLKESPERPGPGYMDPVELGIMEQNWAADDGEGSNPFELQLPPEQMIPFLHSFAATSNLTSLVSQYL